MRCLSLLALFLLLVSACSPAAPTPESSSEREIPEDKPQARDSTAAKPPRSLAGNLKTELVADGLQLPANLAFAPDGRLFLTEVSLGQVRVIDRGSLLSEPFVKVDAAPRQEMGLLGLALDPDFARNRHLYLYYSQAKDGRAWRNRVVRFTEVDGKGDNMQVVLDDLPIGIRTQFGQHNGGRLGFGPDGKLYVATGDAGDRADARKVDRLRGKLLRVNSDGSVPGDNPFPGLPAYAYGLRNPWGLAFHPVTGAPYVTDNGPDAHDEVNHIEPGGNYGWPQAMGVVKGQQFIDPIWESRAERTGITGLSFYTGDLFPEYKHDLLFCTFLNGSLHRLRLSGPKLRVETQDLLSDQCHLDVVTGPDGAIYISSINKIQRLVPAVS
jgi:glucose/arabinose dehydrogenase